MTRMRLDLDGSWDFFPDPEQIFQHNTLAQTTPHTIMVPGPWQAQFPHLRDYSGVAWYRRTFKLSDQQNTMPDSTYLLHFGAVDYHTTVWLNGQCIGEQEGGYLPFELTLDSALHLDDSNELVIRVIDPDDDTTRFPQFPFAEIPHGKQSWYGPIGGIWQSVYLEARPATHITRLQITPHVELEQIQAMVHLNQPASQPLDVYLTITDPHGHTSSYHEMLDPCSSICHTTLPIPHPLLWDLDTPHLYTLEAALRPVTATSDDDTVPVLDAFSSTFGMRTIAAAPTGHLLLNGQIIYLRGALDQDYYPDMLYTPFSDAELDAQCAMAKHMGLNCLRTHIKITDPRYYDAADRAGLLIWTELPNWEKLTPAVRQRALKTLKGMVERDWNHPSIIIWTIINESWGVDLTNPHHRAWLAESYAYLKQLDPYRLVVGNSACFSNFHVVTDIEDFHNYYAIPDHYRQWHDWVQSFASRPPWTFAHSYQDIARWQEFLSDPWNPLPRPYAREVQRRGNEPLIVSEFGNWGLPDIAKLRAHYGGEPWWFETGIEWGDGVVYPHGIEQRFKMFHLDKVFPTLSDLAAASQRMQFTALKHQIEQMRLHASIVGYIITEFTDVHWECNGLLDLCRNPKAFYDVIGNVNSADVIVPDWTRLVFWEEEQCEIRLVLSHFSQTDLQASCLEWHFDLWPHICGRFDNLMPRQGEVLPIGSINCRLPRIEQSVRARLELRLFDAAGRLITHNHQEIYLFPRQVLALGLREITPVRVCIPDMPEIGSHLSDTGYLITENLDIASIAIAEQLTDELRSYIYNGGCVLWMPDSSQAKQTHLGTLGIAQRQGRTWQGDWASNFNWIRQDRMFAAIPTDRLVDFAFADLTPDCVIVGLSPREFAANVHAGLFVGWLHHTVALIAEHRLGDGRLLISTFRLRHHIHDNPVAQIMVNDMLLYLARTFRE